MDVDVDVQELLEKVDDEYEEENMKKKKKKKKLKKILKEGRTQHISIKNNNEAVFLVHYGRELIYIRLNDRIEKY